MHQTSLARSVVAALTDQAVFVLGAAATAWAHRSGGWRASLPIGLVALVTSGRALRGLENLVHEGSHFNWDRNDRQRNDRFAQVLAADPMGQDLDSY
ncbi:MAG: hypothetical protein LBK95_11585 [Bifidobacteriaceae bacterium]|jgi:fatty acid desaturase|nr:hypothetical protein [Bifidobacteriaceae bacterium]